MSHSLLPYQHGLAPVVYCVTEPPLGKLIRISSGQGDQRVPDLLRTHAFNLAAIECLRHSSFKSLWVSSKLKILGQQEHMLKRPEVVVQVIPHQADEIIHELRGNRLLRLFVFVYRLIDSLAHDALPHPIHDDGREVIISSHHPIREVITGSVVIPALRRADPFSEMRLSPNHLSGISITVLIITGKLDPTLTPTFKSEVVHIVSNPFYETSELCSLLFCIPHLTPHAVPWTPVYFLLSVGKGR